MARPEVVLGSMRPNVTSFNSTDAHRASDSYAMRPATPGWRPAPHDRPNAHHPAQPADATTPARTGQTFRPAKQAAYESLLRVFGDEWFSSFDPATRQRLLTQGRAIHVRRGEFVVQRGDAANGLFGVVSGVLAASSLLHDGRQIIFGLLESGDWCGEASSLDGLPRTHDIHALQDSQLLHVAPRVFEEAMQDARFARAIAVLQTARIRAMFSFFEDAALRSTRARIARRLLRLARGDARAYPRDRTVIPLTHETLSMMLGVTRQTLSLELKALAASGALSLSYGRIVIEAKQILAALGED